MCVALYQDEDGVIVVGVFASESDAERYCLKKNEVSADDPFSYEYGEMGGDENY